MASAKNSKSANKRVSESLSPINPPPKKTPMSQTVDLDETVGYSANECLQVQDRDDSPCDAAIFRAMELFLKSDRAHSLFGDLVQTAVTAALLPLKNGFDALKSENCSLKNDLHIVKDELAKVKQQMDNQLQELKKPNIVMTTTWSDVDNEASAKQVALFACDILLLPKDGLGITDCYRMGKKLVQPDHGEQSTRTSSYGRPIMVKFNTVQEKQVFVEAARKIKSGKLTPPVYINDDLTKNRRDCFKSARVMKERKEIADTWISNGQIFIKSLDGRKRLFVH